MMVQADMTVTQEALQKFSARQLRLAFMMQLWNTKMDFREDLIKDVKIKEEMFDVSPSPVFVPFHAMVFSLFLELVVSLLFKVERR